MKVVSRSEWKEQYVEAQAPASVCREGKEEKQQCFLTGDLLYLQGEDLWGGISGFFWNQSLSRCSVNVGKTWSQILALPLTHWYVTNSAPL